MPIPSKSSKRVKIYHESHNEYNGGCVYALGTGDMGQLGLGEDYLIAKRPIKIPNIPSNCIQVSAGGVHSACLTKDGKVFTWGCNDDGALGRLTESTESEKKKVIDEYNADRVRGEIEHLKIVQISCGDSHTAALTDDGNVYIWGTFRNLNGNIGLLKHKKTERFPTSLKFKYTEEKPVIIKIASGNNHLCCLSSDGRLYTFGNWENGQIGRDCTEEFDIVDNFVDESNAPDPDEVKLTYEEKCLNLYLTPFAVEISNYIRFDDCWAGAYGTFARSKRTKEIYACGLNNYLQLNIDPTSTDRTQSANLIIKRFTRWKGLSINKRDKSDGFIVNNISCGEHHTLISCNNGSVFSIGLYNYGRLGLGKRTEDAIIPELNPIFNLQSEHVYKIATSAATSLAISTDYKLYGWGMCDNNQIPFKEDIFEPKYIPLSGPCMDISIGAQHSLLIVN